MQAPAAPGWAPLHYYGYPYINYAPPPPMWGPLPPMGPQDAALLNTLAGSGDPIAHAGVLDILRSRMVPAPHVGYGYAPPHDLNVPPEQAK